MATRAEMIAEMEDEMDRSDATAFASKISAAIRKFQKERFWFNESRSVTFNTVQGTSDYSFATIGTEFYTIDAAFITDGSTVRELGNQDYVRLEYLLGNAGTTQGSPTLFGYIEKSLRLYPIPNGVYTIRLEGHAKLAEPANDADTANDWMNEAYDLIKADAKRRLFAQKYRDTEGAAIETIAVADALSDLRDATTSKIGTGIVRSTQF